MAANNFLACFNETESFEGGYVNNPHDPGGATLKGVTQAVYSAYLKEHGRPDAAVRGASDADIQAIYRDGYWNPVRGDDLPVGLDLVMVDTAWGSGPVQAIKFLQRKINVDIIDGRFGPKTLDALEPYMTGAASTQLLNEICAERETFFRSLSTWKYFGVGWERRLNGIHEKALAMNAAALANSSVANAPPTSGSSGAQKEPNMANQQPTAQQQPAASAPGTPQWLKDVEIGFDMLQNFNFSQIGDVIKTGLQQAQTDPVGAIENVANVAVKAAAVAGVPFAGTAEEFLPMAENLLNFALKFKSLFPDHAAVRATQISSPSNLTAQSLSGANGG